jgi:hypothetical protein
MVSTGIISFYFSTHANRAEGKRSERIDCSAVNLKHGTVSLHFDDLFPPVEKFLRRYPFLQAEPIYKIGDQVDGGWAYARMKS